MTAHLVGRGREAEIIALDNGRVLREKPEPHDVEVEARTMEYVRAHGMLVPRGHETRSNGL